MLPNGDGSDLTRLYCFEQSTVVQWSDMGALAAQVIKGFRKERMCARASTLLCICEYLGSFGGTIREIVEMTDHGARPGPALCSQGCQVSLHDKCRHGCPSLLLTLVQYDYKWEEIRESEV